MEEGVEWCVVVRGYVVWSYFDPMYEEDHRLQSVLYACGEEVEGVELGGGYFRGELLYSGKRNNLLRPVRGRCVRVEPMILKY